MKNLYWLTFSLFLLFAYQFLLPGGLLGCSSSPPSAPVLVPLKNYALGVENGTLVFSTGERGRATTSISINGKSNGWYFQDGKVPAAMVPPIPMLWASCCSSNRQKALPPVPPLSKHGPQLPPAENPDVAIRHSPLVAIFLALIFREVIISLFVGVYFGAFIAGGMRIDSFYYFILSFLEVVQRYVINALNDSAHLAILVFSLLIGGMVAIISRNGGMVRVVQVFSRYAQSPKSAQFITWLLGVVSFRRLRQHPDRRQYHAQSDGPI
ncbi:MAG: hypothetical protein H6559_34680 [Lewinellaceae bacterium]|nr:hypothetical protein [Lewinellaceae bacterium]